MHERFVTVESKPMVVPTTQGDVIIDVANFGTLPLLETVKNVGIRLSGGADSAILAYMLAIYKRDYRPHLKLRPITCVNPIKPYQEIFAKRVMAKITELTGVEFDEHYVGYLEGIDYRKEQGIFSATLYSENKLDVQYMGETSNPPLEVEADWDVDGAGRDKSRDGFDTTHVPITKYRPFRNINKKAVAELYEYFGVLESLFPLTRSCEITLEWSNDVNFINHCNRCWFCFERKWGFGRYV